MAEPKIADRKYSGGAWVITGSGGVMVESSEIKALRAAVATGGTHQFVKYGEVVGALGGTQPAVTPTKAVGRTDVATDGF